MPLSKWLVGIVIGVSIGLIGCIVTIRAYGYVFAGPESSIYTDEDAAIIQRDFGGLPSMYATRSANGPNPIHRT
jgi:hypothetical protein